MENDAGDGSVKSAKTRKMKRIGIIGCGCRLESYIQQMGATIGTEFQIVALADPREKSREIYRKKYAAPSAIEFESGPALLDAVGGTLDAVMIGSPNALHADSLIPAIERDLIILTEKPVVTTRRDCAKVWRMAQAHPAARIVVGFVLRYTPFYNTIHRLIREGAVGRILSIQMTEQLGLPLSSVYTRYWRRHNHLAGTLLLEKCSHDLDIITWLADAQPDEVHSFQRRTHFLPREDAALRCRDCRYRGSCHYSDRFMKTIFIGTEAPGDDDLNPLIFYKDDLCVYNSDKDVPDHQTVNIAFNDGMLATFQVMMNQPKTTRTITVFGTEGQITGDLADDRLAIRRLPAPGHLQEEQIDWEAIPVEHDDSPHHGGDSIITAEFMAMLRGEVQKPLAGLREGLDAVLFSLAAEQSCLRNETVDLDDIRFSVYGE